MTADEFERDFARKCGLDVDDLRTLGRIVAPCSCGMTKCPGWRSTTRAAEGLPEGFPQSELPAIAARPVTMETIRAITTERSRDEFVERFRENMHQGNRKHDRSFR